VPVGLDGVELIIKVEESFGIAITDEEAGRIRTVGDLLDTVLAKLSPGDRRVCLTSAAFYEVRRQVMVETGRPRKELAPKAALELLFPSRERYGAWRRMRSRSGLKWPRLAVPGKLLGGLMALSLASSLLWAARDGLQPADGFGALFWAAVLFLASLIVLARVPGIDRALPRELNSVGDLAVSVLALNHAHFAQKARSWNESEAWVAVRGCIAEQIGVPESEIKRESGLVDELGVE